MSKSRFIAFTEQYVLAPLIETYNKQVKPDEESKGPAVTSKTLLAASLLDIMQKVHALKLDDNVGYTYMGRRFRDYFVQIYFMNLFRAMPKAERDAIDAYMENGSVLHDDPSITKLIESDITGAKEGDDQSYVYVCDTCGEATVFTDRRGIDKTYMTGVCLTLQCIVNDICEHLGLHPVSCEVIDDATYESFLASLRRDVDDIANVGSAFQRMSPDIIPRTTMQSPGEGIIESSITLDSGESSSGDFESPTETTLAQRGDSEGSGGGGLVEGTVDDQDVSMVAMSQEDQQQQQDQILYYLGEGTKQIIKEEDGEEQDK